MPPLCLSSASNRPQLRLLCRRFLKTHLLQELLFLLPWGCVSALRSVRQLGLPQLMLGGAPDAGEGLMLGEGLLLD